jgi:RNA 2',3'-cyclic 3'-phosphodiesterase
MKDDSLRLFFALRCPPRLAEAITTWRDDLHLPGRPVATANLHLTLVFLGQQPLTQLPTLLSLAASVQVPVFDLHLDHLGRFNNGLLYLAPSRPPVALQGLAQGLRDALQEAGIRLDDRPFRAHLSLLRRCPRLPDDATPSFDWPVSHFGLFASEQSAHGSHYRQLQHWPLRPNEAP